MKNEVTVTHTYTEHLTLTGYGVSKVIFERMSKLKGRDHNATFGVFPVGSGVDVVYTWRTKEDVDA